MTAPHPGDPAKHVVAVYPGTFDPITNGHLDILRRALALFDRIVVTIAVNPRKQPLFTVEQRIGFIRDALGYQPTFFVISGTVALAGVWAAFALKRDDEEVEGDPFIRDSQRIEIVASPA